MAGQQGRQDPKEAALAEARCLNPHPEQVTDPEFLAQRLLRRPGRGAGQVRDGAQGRRGAPVTEAAAAFGYSRPAYYAAAAALESSGLEGLVPAGPGRARPQADRGDPRLGRGAAGRRSALRPAQLPDRIEEALGVRVHPRSVERALARRRERHSKSRGTARPRDAEGG